MKGPAFGRRIFFGKVKQIAGEVRVESTSEVVVDQSEGHNAALNGFDPEP